MALQFKNIAIVGAGGSIGTYVLQALLAEPSFAVTVIQRTSSRAKPPSSVRVLTVPDAFPVDALVEAFKGQDVVINCISNPNLEEQMRFVDAALAGGVRRYVPSEYGMDNSNPRAQELNVIFKTKGAVQDYLRKQQDKMEWMSISCGMWIKWSMAHNFLGMHIKEKRLVSWDEGEGKFSASTEENTALALVRSLTLMPHETKNRSIFLSDFATTQNELFAEIERQTGESFKRERIDTESYIEDMTNAYKGGNVAALYALVETGFVCGKYGAYLEDGHEIMSEKLGLPKKTLQQVVAAGLASLS